MEELPITVPLEVAQSAAGGPVKPRLRGLSHEVAAFVFPILGLIGVLVARTGGAKVAVGVYAVGVSAMYATSACYHRGHWLAAAKRRMRRLDHSMILVAIASTYTPVAAIGLSRATAWVLLSLIWALTVAGVVVRNLWLEAPRWLTAAIYVAVGWAAVAVMPEMWAQLGVATFALVMAGGVVYSLGALVYALHRPDPVPSVFGYHEVFHALVVAAGLVFYAAVINVVVRG